MAVIGKVASSRAISCWSVFLAMKFMMAAGAIFIEKSTATFDVSTIKPVKKGGETFDWLSVSTSLIFMMPNCLFFCKTPRRAFLGADTDKLQQGVRVDYHQGDNQRIDSQGFDHGETHHHGG